MSKILKAMDDNIIAKSRDEKPRDYLGMSSIGHGCELKLWYQFHWAAPNDFDAATLRKFADGHASEAIITQRLIDAGVDISPLNENGLQYELTLFNGLFRGHTDGIISVDTDDGNLAAMVFEAKCVQVDIFKTVLAAKENHPNAVLANWNQTYFGQAQMYGGLLGMDCYHIVSTAGSRESVDFITKRDPAVLEELTDKALRIIKSTHGDNLTKISRTPSWWECKICSYAGICHYGDSYQKNCRTCEHSQVVIDDGVWICAKDSTELPYEKQLVGCDTWEHKHETL